MSEFTEAGEEIEATDTEMLSVVLVALFLLTLFAGLLALAIFLVF
jgi:hypothetical protein